MLAGSEKRQLVIKTVEKILEQVDCADYPLTKIIYALSGALSDPKVGAVALYMVAKDMGLTEIVQQEL